MSKNTLPSAKKIDRYLGVRPFADNAQDSRLFFGRESETHQLMHQILASRMLVVSGKSGLGKTSLLHTAVFPGLREKDFFPISIRLNQIDSNLQQIFTHNLKEASEKASVDYSATDESGVWETYKTASFWKGERLLTPILVIDQFEELFSLWQGQQRNQLITQLAELINPYVPERIQAKRREKTTWVYGEQALDIKIVLCLREDYVGELQSLVDPIPSILENRFRLTAMKRSQAEQAIIGPAALPEPIYSSPVFSYKQTGLDELMDFLSGIENQIEPFQLQILCQQIEEKLRHSKNLEHPLTIDKGFLGGTQAMQRIIGGFYLDAIKFLKRTHQGRARRFCEEGLLTLDGKRLSMEKSEIIRRYKLGENELQQLVQSRLLRKEPRLGSFYYELSHDSLTVPVQEKKRWRFSLGQKLILSGVLVSVILGFWLLERERQQQANFLKATEVQRDKALAAEKQAEAARIAAEELIEFMVFDLSEKLAPVGRLDIVESAQQQIAHYYQRFGSSENPSELRRKSAFYTRQGDLLLSQGDLKRAEREYRKSLAIRADLSKKDPSNSGWLRDLSVSYNKVGGILKSQGDLKGAERVYRKSLVIRAELSKTDSSKSSWQRDLSFSYDNIGNILRSQGDLKRAEREYRKSLAIRADLSKKTLSNSNWQRNLSLSYDNIGNILRSQGDLKGAAREYRKSLAIRADLSKITPSNSGWQRDLSVSYDNIGNILKNQGNLKGAEREYRKSLAIRADLSKTDPSNSGWQRDLSVSYNKEGDILKSQRDLKGAEREYRKSLEIAKNLSKTDPSNRGWKRDLSVSYNKVGDILKSQSNLKGAEKEYKKSLEIAKNLTKTVPSNSEWQQDLAFSFFKLASIHKQQGGESLPLSKNYFEKALTLTKNLKQQGRLPERKMFWVGFFEKELAEMNIKSR